MFACTVDPATRDCRRPPIDSSASGTLPGMSQVPAIPAQPRRVPGVMIRWSVWIATGVLFLLLLWRIWRTSSRDVRLMVSVTNTRESGFTFNVHVQDIADKASTATGVAVRNDGQQQPQQQQEQQQKRQKRQEHNHEEERGRRGSEIPPVTHQLPPNESWSKAREDLSQRRREHKRTKRNILVRDLLTAAQRDRVDAYSKSRGKTCVRIDDPWTEAKSNQPGMVPIPESWCSECAQQEAQQKIYLFVMGVPFSGTSAMHRVMLSSPNATHLCELLSPSKSNCEGLKMVIPKALFPRRWESGVFPEDFRTDVLDQYASRWWNNDSCFRIDKSPPFLGKVEQMVEQLVDRDGLRVAFLFLTHSRCSKDLMNRMRTLAFGYQYLLDRNIPVVHVKYQDLVKNLSAEVDKINRWAGCLGANATRPVYAHSEKEATMFNMFKTQIVADFVSNVNWTEKYRNIPMQEEELESYAYFGYDV
ncbi:hypothetical protein FVE85_1146 [Porphyridium purpureum]|uniref:Uncharacterized protein n=1 Tax=Porphyridium purpureum TaxID=35688 RepID=A0A5J4Z4A8_PORPP|nr:hypothetical protein FVE85_1146 [Porphyridium purpureum]|eukprot:POR3571..scf208_2